jgi:hypothetical protein
MCRQELAARRPYGGVLWLCALFTLGSVSVAAQVGAQDKPAKQDEQAEETEDATPLNDEAADDREPQKQDENAKEAVPTPSLATPPPASPLATPPLVKVGGGFILYYRHSLRGQRPPTGYQDVFEVYKGQVLIDGKLERFGLHVDFRVRDSLLKPFYKGTAWLEEAYAFAELVSPDSAYGPLVLKAGKIYQQFGRFWDNSFYGNIHLRDGLKIDPDYGLSLEGELMRAAQFGAKYFFQYFVIDGSTNSSNPGRDTFSDVVAPGAVPPRRRNMLIGRVEPFVKIGTFTVLKVAGSVEHFTAADLPQYGDQDVTRWGLDTTLQVGPLSAWAEYTRQNGRSTTDFPYPANAMAMPPTAARAYYNANYLLFGGQFTYDRFAVRYNFSQGDYLNVPNAGFTAYEFYREHTHVPGVMIKAYDWLYLMLEFALFERVTPLGTTVIDKSINVTIHGRI